MDGCRSGFRGRVTSRQTSPWLMRVFLSLDGGRGGARSPPVGHIHLGSGGTRPFSAPGGHTLPRAFARLWITITAVSQVWCSGSERVDSENQACRKLPGAEPRLRTHRGKELRSKPTIQRSPYAMTGTTRRPWVIRINSSKPFESAETLISRNRTPLPVRYARASSLASQAALV